tara:strand:+ start:340 stop:840 length:501 start_codon:yes stop_codon:yes gene_type:complete
MIHIEIHGGFVPLKSKGATDKDQKVFKSKDPLTLLRKALANKLRSQHWRAAHGAKAKWMEAAKTHAKISGTPVEGHAIVVVIHCLPGKCDIDAPIKVLLDAFQGDLFANGDDKSAQSLIIRKMEPQRDCLSPQVHLYAFSKETEYDEANRTASEALLTDHPYIGQG